MLSISVAPQPNKTGTLPCSPQVILRLWQDTLGHSINSRYRNSERPRGPEPPTTTRMTAERFRELQASFVARIEAGPPYKAHQYVFTMIGDLDTSGPRALRVISPFPDLGAAPGP
jgi:hypothetical protein